MIISREFSDIFKMYYSNLGLALVFQLFQSLCRLTVPIPVVSKEANPLYS